LEKTINELTTLIKNQKEKIIQAYLRFAPCKELLKKLITTHLEYTKAKQQKRPVIKLRKQKESLFDELTEKLSEEVMEEVEAMLTDCDELVRTELELENKFGSSITVEFDAKERIKITYNCFNFGNINNQDGHVFIANRIGDNANFSYSNLIELPEQEQKEYQQTQPQAQILHHPPKTN